MEHPAQALIGGAWQRRMPDWRDVAAIILVVAVLLLVGTAGRQMLAPWIVAEQPAISLSPAALPMYAVRTTTRMLLALAASLIFTFTYATLAAKSRRAEAVLIPLLDVLQSVPILGYLSCTVVFFVSLFPRGTLGPECAAIFARFTSQAWNMVISFHQGLRTIPRDLDEASRVFRFSAWQRFWRLDSAFQGIVDEIYSDLTSRSLESIVAHRQPHGGAAQPLPRVSINQISGFVERFLARPYVGRAELATLADALALQVDDLFPTAEALHILEFAELTGKALKLTAAGRVFAQSDTSQRKRLFREHLLRFVPLAAHIHHVLDEREDHEAPRVRFEAELEGHLNNQEAEQTLRTVTGWGRYAELFGYDDKSRRYLSTGDTR